MKLNQTKADQEINKTRIEDVGFSGRTFKFFQDRNIRTIGGIVNRTKSELQNLLNISEKDAYIILEKIKEFLSKEPVHESVQITETAEIQPKKTEKGPPKLLEVGDEEDIIRTLAEKLGATKNEVISPSRKQWLVRVRDLIVYLLREYGDMSYPAIGRLLGGRDHTTIIHAHKKIKKLAKETSLFQYKLDELISSVKTIKERKIQVEQEIISNILTGDIPKQRRSTPVIKEISERNLKVLELYREGLTLENISNEVGVTRERVRQIAFTTIKQVAINEAVTKGIVMDSDVLMEEELKKRNSAKEKKNGKRKIDKPKEKRWSRYHTSCQKCGTTTISHVRKGLCEQCIGQFRGGLRENIISQHENKCDSCSKTRAEAAALYGRDLYITKDRKVFCKACFRNYSGKRLGSYKNYKWSRFHSQCKSCGTSSIPHAGKGLCEKCSDKRTPNQRESIIIKHGSICDSCNINRSAAKSTLGRDLFVIKLDKVLCKTCFHKYTKSSK